MLHHVGAHDDRPVASLVGGRVEPVVDRWRRGVKLTAPPNPLVPEAVVRAEQSFVADLAQRYLLGDRWVVDVEADSGRRVRLARGSREEAIAAAKRIHAGVTARGVAFVKTLDT